MTPSSPQPMRSLLFVPGDSEKKLAKAEGLAADVLIFDLEDAVVPSVVSLTEIPTIRLSVRQLFTTRWPNSVCARQYSSSRCSAAGLWVRVLNSTLSVSVMVRRMA